MTPSAEPPNSASVSLGDIAGQLWKSVLADMRRVGPGEVRCGHCGVVAPAENFQRPACTENGRHRDYRYCCACGNSIDWPTGRYTDYEHAQALLRRVYKGAAA